MPPNIVEVPIPEDVNATVSKNDTSAETGNLRRNVPPPAVSSDEYKLRTYLSTLNLLAHILIGVVTGASLLFAFRGGMPLGATPQHIVLCVLGYQLLMGEAILSLASDNGWSLHLRLVDKRRAHYILQIMGAALAIAGSFVKIIDKANSPNPTHFHSPHGISALIALIFTTVSLVNGVTSLWAYELRSLLPGNLSKLTHICFGTVAFAAACLTLCFGFDKEFFKAWITDELAYTLIAFTATFTFIVILTPLATFYLKSKALVARN